MPHYADGTEAKVGDIVKGKGYNVKDESGALKEIVGTLIHVTPGSTSCNVKIAHAVAEKLPEDFKQPDYKYTGPKTGVTLTDGFAVTSNIEYGQANHFLKVG